jgi:hypothetical protein
MHYHQNPSELAQEYHLAKQTKVLRNPHPQSNLCWKQSNLDDRFSKQLRHLAAVS